jgi:hypothetical protein
MTLTFFCNGCATERDFDRDYGLLIITPKDGIKRICRVCRKPNAAIDDVYFDGRPEENLADDPLTGKPRVFTSKAEKAAYLRERNIIEAGDRLHGAPISLATSSQPKQNSRDAVRRAISQVKQMGRDVRRQAYLKIVKENGHAFRER